MSGTDANGSAFAHPWLFGSQNSTYVDDYMRISPLIWRRFAHLSGDSFPRHLCSFLDEIDKVYQASICQDFERGCIPELKFLLAAELVDPLF